MCFSSPSITVDQLRLRSGVAHIQNLEYAYDAPKSLPGTPCTPAKLEHEHTTFIMLVVHLFCFCIQAGHLTKVCTLLVIFKRQRGNDAASPRKPSIEHNLVTSADTSPMVSCRHIAYVCICYLETCERQDSV